MEATVTQGNSSSNGYARRFELRYEYKLFGAIIPDVIDAAAVRKHAVDGLKLFSMSQVWSGKDEVLLGFGLPNTYTVVPNGEGGYQKFAVKSLWRAPSKVEDTGKRHLVQAGVQLRLKNAPAQAAERLREAMKYFTGATFITCVNGNMHAWERAGFSSGHEDLTEHKWPYQLLKSLLTYGLWYTPLDEQGRALDPIKIEFDIVRTSTDEFRIYSWHLVKATLLTLCRHADRSAMNMAKKNKVAAFFYKAAMMPGQWLARMRNKEEPVFGPVAPALPDDLPVDSDINLRVTDASHLGVLLRQLWGPHTLFEATSPRMVVPDSAMTLRPFPQANPNFVTRVKKALLFSKPVIKLIRLVLAPKYVELGNLNERDVYDRLRTHSDVAPAMYNIVMTRTRVVIARLNVALKLIDWILSKHVLVSGYDPDTIFAGEVYKDVEGTIHLTRNSGTYQPSEEELEMARDILQGIFPHLRIVIDAMP